MKKNPTLIVIIIFLSLALVLSVVYGATGIPKAVSSPTVTVVISTNTSLPTPTPDVCSPENIEIQVKRVHLLMREFDDTSLLIQTTLLQATTVALVQDLQKIKRTAEDQQVPACLDDLKEYELAFMNSMIEAYTTALAFLNAYGPNGDQAALDALIQPLITQALVHLQRYGNEHARLLGLTPVPVSTLSPEATSTPSPQ